MSADIHPGLVDVSNESCGDRRLQLDFLIDRNRDRIVLYIFSLIQDAHAAEDICQRSCIVMWKKFDEYDAHRSFLAWACGIARFETLNYCRSVGSDRLLFKSDVMHLLAGTLDEIPDEALDDRLGALRRCVQKLPATQQSMLSRVYADGCSCETVAKEMGCSLRTVYNRMSLVRRRLLECIQRSSRSNPLNGYPILMNHEE
jgi:RNA polymerase sigma-70 factor, ECF subfamily